MEESHRRSQSHTTGSANRLFASSLLILAVVLCCAGCGENVEVEPRTSTTLARIDTSVVTEVAFDESLSQWETDPSAATPAQWRRRLQLLIDRQLLVLEARDLGFYDDPRVLREVELWERSRIIPELLETGAGDAKPFTDEEVDDFFYATGANRELLVGRLILDDSTRATDALKDLQGKMSFARVAHTYGGAGQRAFADSVWLNGLSVTDDQLRSLLSLFVGDAEMFSHGGRYLVAVVLEERSVSVDERRPVAEEAFKREQRKEANLAYLASLMQKYDVYVDSVALNDLHSAAAENQTDPGLRLVRSSLGNWTTGQYRDAIERLPAAQRSTPGLRDLKLQVLRAYAVDQLLPREVEARGLDSGITRRRQTMREQKAIEALWAAKGLSQVTVSETELRRYFTANRARYARDMTGPAAAASGRAKVLQDLKEARAVPLFDEYVAELRTRFRHRVSIDGARFRAYVARKAGAPVRSPTVNGCDQLNSFDATSRGEMDIHFGGEVGYTYQPGCLAVSTGTIVTFGGDFSAHPLAPGRIDGPDVITDDASPLRPTASGVEARFLMTQPGAYGYFCDRHVADAMVGAIFVE